MIILGKAARLGELKRLCHKIARKRRGKLTRCVLLLQHNAPANTSQVAITAATECGFEILPHPSYSTDMLLLISICSQN